MSDIHHRLRACKRRRGLGPKKRFRILNRDGFKCRYCGQSAPDVVLHVDHVEPFCQGGSDDDENLVTACETCNAGKSDDSIIDQHDQARMLIHRLIWRYLRWSDNAERNESALNIILAFWRGHDFHRLVEIGEAAENLADVKFCLQYLERITEEDE
jgi:hypothetical protein